MAGFAVLHMTKGSGSSGGMQGHNERTYDVKNADSKLEHLNFFVGHHSTPEKKGSITIEATKENSREGSYKSREEEIIEKRTIRRKIQHNAVKRLSFTLSGSHENMKKLEKEGKIQKWAIENYKFIGRKYGFSNITEFAVHMDERTPHIHCMVVPMVKTEKGTKLCARDLTSKDQLKELQTEYAEAMQPFGLQRGMEGSRATHEDVKEFYARIGKSKELQQTFAAIPNIEVETNMLESKEKFKKKVLDQANLILSRNVKFEEEKARAIVSKFIESNRRTFRADLHQNKLKLDAEDKKKLKTLQNIDQKIEGKTRENQFIEKLKSAIKNKDTAEIKEVVNSFIKKEASKSKDRGL